MEAAKDQGICRWGNTEVAATTCQEQCPIIFSFTVAIYPAARLRSIQWNEDDDLLREREREREREKAENEERENKKRGI